MAFNAYGAAKTPTTLPPLLGSFDTLEEAIYEIVVKRSGAGQVHVLGENDCGYDTIPIGTAQRERGKRGKWLKADVHLGAARTHRSHCISIGMAFEEIYS